jgi:hypothetical protein
MLEEFHDRAELFALSLRPLEQYYHLASPDLFEAAHSAVFAAIGRLHPKLPLHCPPAPGRVVYLLQRPDGYRAQLFLLLLSPTLVSLQMCPSLLLDLNNIKEAQRIPLPPEVQHHFRYVFASCHEEIIKFVRIATSLEGLDPPPPPGRMEDILTWGAMYYPDLADKELAARAGVEHQSIRNQRFKTRRLKRSPRANKQPS